MIGAVALERYPIQHKNKLSKGKGARGELKQERE